MTRRHDFEDFPHAGLKWSGWIEYATVTNSRLLNPYDRENPPDYSDPEFELVDWGDIDADEPTARAVAEAVFKDQYNELEEEA
jgi:hypothetical protein